MKWFVGLGALCFMISCTEKKHSKTNPPSSLVEGRDYKIIYPFSDSSHILTLRTFDTSFNYTYEKSNLVLSQIRIQNGVKDTVFQDSLYSRNSSDADRIINFSFKDYNFDGQLDILLPYASDTRGNREFYLFLVDDINKELTPVKGFKEIGNPEVDSINRIIKSFVLSGQSFMKFYFIDRDDSLQDLKGYVGYTLINERADSLNYLKALRKASVTKAQLLKSKSEAEALEKEICSRIWALPEVKERYAYVKKASEGKRTLHLLLYETPSKENPYYWIKVSEDNGSGMDHAHFNFHVYLNPIRIRYFDTVSDDLEAISLHKWRDRIKKRGY